MGRSFYLAPLLLLLAACGGRTELGAARADASVVDAGVPRDAGVDRGVPAAPGSVVLFGGIGGPAAVTPFGDTWGWDGLAWTELQTGGPAPRWGAASGLRDGKLVVFGGCPGTTAYLDDTWTFDGSAWASVPSSGPVARVYAATAPSAGSLLMMGGDPSAAPWLTEMWSFDGKAWNKLGASLAGLPANSVGGPGLPFQPAVSLAGRVVLFGAIGPQNQVLGDTWSFDGTAWHQLPVKGPAGRYGAVFATLGNEAVLFGGSTDWVGEHPEGDTWLFDGKSWKAVPGPGPSPRVLAAAAEHDGKLVLFGGEDAIDHVLDDTWEFDGTSWAQLPVHGPPARAAAAMTTLP